MLFSVSYIFLDWDHILPFVFTISNSYVGTTVAEIYKKVDENGLVKCHTVLVVGMKYFMM